MPPRSPRPSSSRTRSAHPTRPHHSSLGKPANIIDRDAVWQALRAAWESDAPELLFGLGRRRAGKSWVLTRFANAVGGIYYQATKRTEAEQLAAISRIVGQHSGDRALTHGVAFPHWEALFAYLAERAAGAPFLLILDEFPYLAEAAPALTSIIQDTWDHHWPGTRAKLVLNGSHISAMRRLEDADQPLYGRRTGRIQFPPFYVEDLCAFVPNYSARDVLLTYGAFGGLPGHLALLRPAQDIAANITRLMLDPGGRLSDEAERLLDAFLGDADVHYSIIQAIAGGDRTWSKITSRLGKPSGSLSRPMRWLEEMQVVSRMVPVTEDPKTSKRTLYRIADPYVAFWHRFIAPLQASGEMSLALPDSLWRGRIAPSLDDYMGSPFEDACRSWVARSSRMPFRSSRIGAWWDATSQNEIDVVALGPDKEVLVGECKWGPVSDQDLVTLRARTALMLPELPAAYRGGQIHYACFGARGQWGNGIAREISAGSVLGFTAEDLLSV